ncbi:hypothetical protein GUJ93_ZPchr0003g18004 [Zizania palustris]|uniref:Uncharacterized protein n=1 Tax=Zizania palustris TaxID=103762 RepID=A0A8J5VWZ6_ZIZPA|nr:hypothetical protein GUJ93_ZPchr0003g18004 [Zizania palustris]
MTAGDGWSSNRGGSEFGLRRARDRGHTGKTTKKEGTGPTLDPYFIQQQTVAVVVVVVAAASSSASACGPHDLRSPSEKFIEQTLILEKSACMEEIVKSVVQERLEPGVVERLPRDEAIQKPSLDGSRASTLEGNAPKISPPAQKRAKLVILAQGVAASLSTECGRHIGEVTRNHDHIGDAEWEVLDLQVEQDGSVTKVEKLRE